MRRHLIPAYKARRRAAERAAFVASIQARTPESRAGVGGLDVQHGANCAPYLSGVAALEQGPTDGGAEGAKAAVRNAGVTGQGA